MLTLTDSASNVNRFGQSACGIETVVLRGKNKPAANIRLNEILKRRALTAGDLGQTLKIEYKLWSVSFLSSAGWVEARNPTDFYR